MYGIFEAAEVLFVDGADVPVAHKHAERMVVLRGVGGPDEAALYYTPDEWEAFGLGVKGKEFDGMLDDAVEISHEAQDALTDAHSDPSEDGDSNSYGVVDGERVVAMRDSKDPEGVMLIFSAVGWTELLGDIKAGRYNLPSDMYELLDERFR